MAEDFLRRAMRLLDRSLGVALTASLFFNFYFVFQSFYSQTSGPGSHGYTTTSDGACVCPSSSASASRIRPSPYPLNGPITWGCLAPSVQAQYTLENKIPVVEKIFRESVLHKYQYNEDQLEDYIIRAGKKEINKDYGVYEALEKYPVKGMRVLVIGTQKPWLEAILVSNKVDLVTTVDYNPPTLDHPKMASISIPELDASTEQFDAVFSYSSIDHDGLGRYEEPLNPYADLELMTKIKGLLKKGGLLFLGLPLGPDYLIFNANRIYGPIRFPLLIKGWSVRDTFGHDREAAFKGKFSKAPVCLMKEACYTEVLHVLAPS